MAACWPFKMYFSVVIASFHLVDLKFVMYVYLNDSSDEFENGADQIQNGHRLAIFGFSFSVFLSVVSAIQSRVLI